MAGEHLDLSSTPNISSDKKRQQDQRPFVGIQFNCCDVYSRIYVNAEGSGYDGKCPRCGKKVNMKIGPGGTSKRFFTAE